MPSKEGNPPVIIKNEREYLEYQAGLLGFEKPSSSKFKATILHEGKSEYFFDNYLPLSRGDGYTNILTHVAEHGNFKEIKLPGTVELDDYHIAIGNPFHFYSKEGNSFILFDISGPTPRKTVLLEDDEEEYSIYGVVSSGLVLIKEESELSLLQSDGQKSVISESLLGIDEDFELFTENDWLIRTYGINLIFKECGNDKTDFYAIVSKEIRRKNNLFKEPIKFEGNDDFVLFQRKYLGFDNKNLEIPKDKELKIIKFQKNVDYYLPYESGIVYKKEGSGELKIKDWFDDSKNHKTILKNTKYTKDIPLGEIRVISSGLVFPRYDSRKIIGFAKLDFDGFGKIIDFSDFNKDKLEDLDFIGANENGVVVKKGNEIIFIDYGGKEKLILEINKKFDRSKITDNGVIISADNKLLFISTN